MGGGTTNTFYRLNDYILFSIPFENISILYIRTSPLPAKDRIIQAFVLRLHVRNLSGGGGGVFIVPYLL